MMKSQLIVRSLLTIALVFLPLLLCVPARAYGYVDPGSGAFVYQAVYAAFLGSAYFLRKLLNRVFKKRQ